MYSGIERLQGDEDDESGATVPSHTVRKGVGDDQESQYVIHIVVFCIILHI